MKQIETQIIIQATPQVVWKKLMSFNDYGTWNPFITSIEGKAVEGDTLEVKLKTGAGSPMTFKPTVLVAQQNVEFRWLGKLGVKGIFDGEHYFRLEPMDENRTRFIHGERFTGALVGVLWAMIGSDTKESFEAMNQALKQTCEILKVA